MAESPGVDLNWVLIFFVERLIEVELRELKWQEGGDRSLPAAGQAGFWGTVGSEAAWVPAGGSCSGGPAPWLVLGGSQQDGEQGQVPADGSPECTAQPFALQVLL